jgi:aminodeoxyfutalosine deaminase
MGNLKISADRIFDGFRFRPNTVLITDEQGKIIDLPATEDAGEDIMRVDGNLCPGMINCHGHLELSHMKGFTPEGTGLVKFVLDVVQQRHFPEEQILLAIEKAEDEMLANGIVAMGDICNNMLTIPQKLKGRIYYHNFIEASGFHPAIAEQRFQRSLDIFREYGKYYSIPIESNSIVPHAPYSVADELWDKIIRFPGNHLFTIHNQETVGENDWFINKTGELGELYERMNIDATAFKPTGKSSLQSFLPRFLPNQSVILVHNVHTSEEDIRFCQLPTVNCQLYWCLCPNANQYITGSMPPVDLFMKNECTIVLGTDSLASNHQLDLLAEIRTIRKHFPSIPIENFLQWATSNGAKALDLDLQLGSFEKGKTPGIIVIDNDLSKARRIK